MSTELRDFLEIPYDRLEELNAANEEAVAQYLSALPGTDFYKQCLQDGLITDEIAHLEWLSREQSVAEDIDQPGFVKFTPHLTREELKQIYCDINYRIEVRPYDYSDGQNRYLATGEKFLKRKSDDQ